MGLPSTQTTQILDSATTSSVRYTKAVKTLKETFKRLKPSVTLLSADVQPFGEKSWVALLSPGGVGRESGNTLNQRLIDPGKTLVIVHHGHRPMPSDGSDSVVKSALWRGHQVLLLHMPLIDWNTNYPSKAGLKVSDTAKGRSFRDHNEIFKTLLSQGYTEGEILRLFLEPIIQGINYFKSQHQTDDINVVMVGLSGGAWSTHLAAAVDTRVRTSIAVAGALPLFARRFSRGSSGDAEQIVPQVFRELDSPDSDAIPDSAAGVASWLEVFALGGIGTNRTQIQILNVFDSCCFGGPVFATYDTFLSGLVNQIGPGQWKLVPDSSHRGHLISPFAISTVIEPLLDGAGIQNVNR